MKFPHACFSFFFLREGEVKNQKPILVSGIDGAQSLDKISEFTVGDLGEGPGRGPGPPLFWVKKEEMTEGKMAAMASKSRPPPPPPFLGSRSGYATDLYCRYCTISLGLSS